MSEHTVPNTAINRLRAAAGLIPAIEAGLNDTKMAPDRAALIAEFCAWTLNHGEQGDAEATRLSKQISDGLGRIKSKLQLTSDTSSSCGLI